HAGLPAPPRQRSSAHPRAAKQDGPQMKQRVLLRAAFASPPPAVMRKAGRERLSTTSEADGVGCGGRGDERAKRSGRWEAVVGEVRASEAKRTVGSCRGRGASERSEADGGKLSWERRRASEAKRPVGRIVPRRRRASEAKRTVWGSRAESDGPA